MRLLLLLVLIGGLGLAYMVLEGHAERPTEETRCLYAPNGRCWEMTETTMLGKRGYALTARGGETDWDRRFRGKAVCWLYAQRAEAGLLLLQCQDGRLFELNLDTGSFRELPTASEPLGASSLFFQSLRSE